MLIHRQNHSDWRRLQLLLRQHQHRSYSSPAQSSCSMTLCLRATSTKVSACCLGSSSQITRNSKYDKSRRRPCGYLQGPSANSCSLQLQATTTQLCTFFSASQTALKLKHESRLTWLLQAKRKPLPLRTTTRVRAKAALALQYSKGQAFQERQRQELQITWPSCFQTLKSSLKMCACFFHQHEMFHLDRCSVIQIEVKNCRKPVSLK